MAKIKEFDCACVQDGGEEDVYSHPKLRVHADRIYINRDCPICQGTGKKPAANAARERLEGKDFHQAVSKLLHAVSELRSNYNSPIARKQLRNAALECEKTLAEPTRMDKATFEEIFGKVEPEPMTHWRVSKIADDICRTIVSGETVRDWMRAIAREEVERHAKGSVLDTVEGLEKCPQCGWSPSQPAPAQQGVFIPEEKRVALDRRLHELMTHNQKAIDANCTCTSCTVWRLLRDAGII